jgi:hypothetical protein
MKSQTLEIHERFGEEYRGKYVFKEMTWAKRSRIIQKYTKYHKLTGDIESSDFIAIQAETIMASLHGQPQSHPITLEKLLGEEEGIPIELGELFSKIVNGLNALSREDTAFLSEPSGDKNPTQPSPTSGYQKSSAGHPSNLQGSQPEPSTPTQSSSTS